MRMGAATAQVVKDMCRCSYAENSEPPVAPISEHCLESTSGPTFSQGGAYEMPLARLLRPGASVSTTEPLCISLDSTSATNGNEPCGIVVQVRGDYMEHRVTEAADVQDVVALVSLRRTVWLDVDTNRLRIGGTASPLVLDERLPLSHHAGRTAPPRADPALSG